MKGKDERLILKQKIPYNQNCKTHSDYKGCMNTIDFRITALYTHRLRIPSFPLQNHFYQKDNRMGDFFWFSETAERVFID